MLAGWRHKAESLVRLAFAAYGLWFVCGCAGVGIDSTRQNEYSRPSDFSPYTETVGWALPGAGGGRPGTGYVGAAVSIELAKSGELSEGWGIDVNYTHNLAENLSIEFSLGTINWQVERSGNSGSLSTLALGISAQLGKPIGAARWYASVGAGWWVNELSGLSGEEAADSPALSLAVGAYIPLWARGSLAIELRYRFSTADVSPSGDSLLLDAFATRLNYVFLY